MYTIELRDVADPTRFQQSLLFSACSVSDEEAAIRMLTHLLEQGVDPLQKDTLKQTPLFYAAKDGKTKVLQFLVDQGIDVNIIDVYGQNAIFWSSSFGHLEACKLLKAHGSDHDHLDEVNQSPLFYAIKNSRLEVTQWLLDQGCKLDVTDKKNTSLVQLAGRSKSTQIKDLLIKYGAPSSKDQRPKSQVEVLNQPRPPKVNERLQEKEFVLQVFDGENYRPITKEEFQMLTKDYPEISNLFDPNDRSHIEEIKIPTVNEQIPIYYHWEKPLRG